ncbi:unnamed protein product [Acanthosepion pharaonis]|uniref:Uncharacterized protein n=1 Tax=Acanthosepion pharaonis TaxID=158019 RepID=A0A812E8I4_ACAPH|nr:unnamed protein product [Sepia pharaonis]
MQSRLHNAVSSAYFCHCHFHTITPLSAPPTSFLFIGFNTLITLSFSISFSQILSFSFLDAFLSHLSKPLLLLLSLPLLSLPPTSTPVVILPLFLFFKLTFSASLPPTTAVSPQPSLYFIPLFITSSSSTLSISFSETLTNFNYLIHLFFISPSHFYSFLHSILLFKLSLTFFLPCLFLLPLIISCLYFSSLVLTPFHRSLFLPYYNSFIFSFMMLYIFFILSSSLYNFFLLFTLHFSYFLNNSLSLILFFIFFYSETSFCICCHHVLFSFFSLFKYHSFFIYKTYFNTSFMSAPSFLDHFKLILIFSSLFTFLFTFLSFSSCFPSLVFSHFPFPLFSSFHFFLSLMLFLSASILFLHFFVVIYLFNLSPLVYFYLLIS